MDEAFALGRARRCGGRKPTDSLSDKPNVIGGWRPLLTLRWTVMRNSAKKASVVTILSAMTCAVARATTETHIWALGRWPDRYGLVGAMEGPDEVYTMVEYGGDRFFTVPLHIYTLVAVMNLVFIAGALYIHHRYRQKKAWIVPGVVAAIVLPIVLMLFLRQFRLLSFGLLALAAVVSSAFRHCRREPVAIPTLAVIVASLFLPIDVAIGPFHFGRRHGTSSGGPHWVRVVDHPFRPETLIERHGEYIVAGCGRPALYTPNWMLVWN